MRFSYKIVGVLVAILLLSMSFAMVDNGSDGGVGVDIAPDVTLTAHNGKDPTIEIDPETPAVSVWSYSYDDVLGSNVELVITPIDGNEVRINSFRIVKEDFDDTYGWNLVTIRVNGNVGINEFKVANNVQIYSPSDCVLADSSIISILGEDEAELWISDFDANICRAREPSDFSNGPSLIFKNFDLLNLETKNEIYFTNISFSSIGELMINSDLSSVSSSFSGKTTSALMADNSITMRKIAKAKISVHKGNADVSGMFVGVGSNEDIDYEYSQHIDIKNCDDFSIEVAGVLNAYGIVMKYSGIENNKTINIVDSKLFINLFGTLSNKPIDAIYYVDHPIPEKIVKPGTIVTDEYVYGYSSLQYSVASIDKEEGEVVMKEMPSFESGKTQRIEGSNLVITTESPEPTPTPVPVPTPSESKDYTALAIMIGVLVVVVILSALAVVMVRKK